MTKARSEELMQAITILGSNIIPLRGERVILAADLAKIYGVTTKRLNQQVVRNRDKFPDEFAFRLTEQEVMNLRLQIATSSLQHGGMRHRPWAFTEHGAIMAATVLNSPQAVRMSVYVVRAFVQMKRALAANSELAARLAEIEKQLTGRLDAHERALVEVIQRTLALLNQPPAPPPVAPKKRRIGFGVAEKSARYRAHRK